MPAVLVHGVPETPAVWGPLRNRLHRTDVITLQLPGFGCPRPEGFGATKEDYVAWLVGELGRLQDGERVDLVGHDWGGGLVLRAVSTRPDLVGSWVTDAAGIGDADFQWHDFAKLWQTPGAGEKYFEEQLALPIEDRAAPFGQLGVPHDAAMTMAAGLDATMAGCILALYRSAVDVGREWAPDFHDVPAPGLTVVPSDDPFLSTDTARNAAHRARASVVDMPGVGHWWMLQGPAGGVGILERFWAELE